MLRVDHRPTFVLHEFPINNSSSVSIFEGYFLVLLKMTSFVVRWQYRPSKEVESHRQKPVVLLQNPRPVQFG